MSLMPKGAQITDLPPEIIFGLTVSYLSHTDVVRLIQTCRFLRHSLNDSDALWAAMTYKRFGVNYIEEGGDWKRACFDVAKMKKLCPHLSEIGARVKRERLEQYRTYCESVKPIKCSDKYCDNTAPDLWMCMTKECSSIGCGRTKAKHGLYHYESVPSHRIAIKINTLEMWCYVCNKWLGQKGTSHTAECERVESIAKAFLLESRASKSGNSLQELAKFNEKRHKERNMNQVKEGDKMYFVADAFLEEWTQFLLGNKMPGSSVDNSSLILPPNHWDLVGLPAGLDNGLPLVHPGIVPFHNFGLVSEATWNYLVEEYGGGPTLSEANIPLNSVMYEPLLRMMEIAKQRIIDFYKHDGDNGDESEDDIE